MKVYAVIELHDACTYGDAFADVELFKNKETAEQYANERKIFVKCEIVEKEIN